MQKKNCRETCPNVSKKKVNARERGKKGKSENRNQSRRHENSQEKAVQESARSSLNSKRQWRHSNVPCRCASVRQESLYATANAADKFSTNSTKSSSSSSSSADQRGGGREEAIDFAHQRDQKLTTAVKEIPASISSKCRRHLKRKREDET